MSMTPVIVSVDPVMMDVKRCRASGSGSKDDLLLGSNELAVAMSCTLDAAAIAGSAGERLFRGGRGGALSSPYAFSAGAGVRRDARGECRGDAPGDRTDGRNASIVDVAALNSAQSWNDH